jgi:hypothetical protein
MANAITPREVRQINGRKGGLRTNSYVNLAQRLADNWAEMTEHDHDVIRVMLRPYIVKPRTSPAK